MSVTHKKLRWSSEIDRPGARPFNPMRRIINVMAHHTPRAHRTTSKSLSLNSVLPNPFAGPKSGASSQSNVNQVISALVHERPKPFKRRKRKLNRRRQWVKGLTCGPHPTALSSSSLSFFSSLAMERIKWEEIKAKKGQIENTTIFLTFRWCPLSKQFSEK